MPIGAIDGCSMGKSEDEVNFACQHKTSHRTAWMDMRLATADRFRRLMVGPVTTS